MSRLGYVIDTTGERATISTSRRGVCEGCNERSTCAFDLALGKDKPVQVVARNPIGARTGDFVEFDLPGHTELKVSLLVWIVPLAGLVAGAVVGSNLHEALGLSRDPGTLLGAFAGLAIAFALLRLYDRRAAKDPRLVPRILKRVDSLECPEPSDARGAEPPASIRNDSNS
jgi:sigma-E factor negative regulatory protein RseC